MNSKLNRLASFFFFILIIATTFGQNNKIDSIVDQAIDEGFIGKVLIAKEGRILYEREHQIDKNHTDHSIYPIASITKFFTSILIFQLIEEGKLSLDQTVSHKELSVIPERFGFISIENLLLHTSGLPK